MYAMFYFTSNRFIGSLLLQIYDEFQRHLRMNMLSLNGVCLQITEIFLIQTTQSLKCQFPNLWQVAFYKPTFINIDSIYSMIVKMYSTERFMIFNCTISTPAHNFTVIVSFFINATVQALKIDLYETVCMCTRMCVGGCVKINKAMRRFDRRIGENSHIELV